MRAFSFLFGLAVVAALSSGVAVYLALRPNSAPASAVSRPTETMSASAKLVAPEKPETSLTWTWVRCVRGDRDACTASTNTMASMEAAGKDVRLCVTVGRSGDCADVVTSLDGRVARFAPAKEAQTPATKAKP